MMDTSILATIQAKLELVLFDYMRCDAMLLR